MAHEPWGKRRNLHRLEAGESIADDLAALGCARRPASVPAMAPSACRACRIVFRSGIVTIPGVLGRWCLDCAQQAAGDDLELFRLFDEARS